MNRFILICGYKNSGKTTFLKKFLNSISRSKEILAAGFLAEGIFEGELKTGFNLVNIQSRAEILLCADQPVKGWGKTGRFYFNPEGISFGKKILKTLPVSINLVIIDEYGPLELGGGGWDPEISELLQKDKQSIMMTVRTEILSNVIQRYAGNEIHVMNINEDKGPGIIREIEKLFGES